MQNSDVSALPFAVKKVKPPVSLYIHVPWCLQKCPYCDFSSIATRQAIDEAAFILAIIHDISVSVKQHAIEKFCSVFFGGGTPSLLSPQIIGQLVNDLFSKALIDQQTEITLEANPATIEHHSFSDFIAAGVNRLSLGIQSFHDQHLQRLGRIHDSKQAMGAILSAVQACDNVSIDIMYALPNQRLAEIDADLDIALSSGISHLSLYQLTIEENTVFGKHPPDCLPDEDRIDDMERLIFNRLVEAGFSQYETSAFAKDTSYQCQHNLNYWHFGDYLGVGPGAHSKLHKDNTTIRQIRTFALADYLNYPEKTIETTVLSASDILTEALMNAGRLTNGFDLQALSDYAGLSLQAFELAVDYAAKNGYWHRLQSRVYPTEKGKRFLNQLLCEMVL